MQCTLLGGCPATQISKSPDFLLSRCKARRHCPSKWVVGRLAFGSESCIQGTTFSAEEATKNDINSVALHALAPRRMGICSKMGKNRSRFLRINKPIAQRPGTKSENWRASPNSWTALQAENEFDSTVFATPDNNWRTDE
jgi:hypothetical protein